jgi:hypothetical protein
VSEAILKEVVEKVRNWGKWGPEDELGTLNYITPGKLRKPPNSSPVGRCLRWGFRSNATARRVARASALTPFI